MVCRRLTGAPARHPWAFAADGRCCTYHPRLANYAIGRALDRGGVSAQVIDERLRNPAGVSPWGIEPPERAGETPGKRENRFGRDLSLRCPFWVGGAHACGIWRDRNAVCRTWFCRHDDGMLGAVAWTSQRRLLTHLERRLADFLVAQAGDRNPQLTDPSATVGPASWKSFYRWCARRLDQMSPEEREQLQTPESIQLRRRVRDHRALGPLPVADVVVPVLGDAILVEGRLWVHGYSRYDFIALPIDSVHFLAALDGRRTWRQALASAHQAGARMDESDVRELQRLDILQPSSRVFDRAVDEGKWLPPRDPAAPVPDVLVANVGRQIAWDDRVWLQGAVPLASLIAPRSVLSFLQDLDGRTPWAAQATAAIDHALVESLYRIGAVRPPNSTDATAFPDTGSAPSSEI